MNIKKNLGNLLALLSIVILSTGNASMAAVGTEEMPQSLKNKR